MGFATRKIARAAAVLLLSGLAAATLVRFAPGFGISEQELDPRLSPSSREELRRVQAVGNNPVQFYIGFLQGLLRGDFGRSSLFDRPVADLIAERAGTTLRNVASALSVSWAVALPVAGALVIRRARVAVQISTALSGVLLSAPSAVLAAICFALYLPPAAAISAVIFPRVFPLLCQQLESVWILPYVKMARAKGVDRTRLLLFHILPAALFPILSLLGVSVSLALGASIPIEVLADSAGLGQLAWRAALARDLPVLVAVTLLLTAVVVSVNSIFDIIMERLSRGTA